MLDFYALNSCKITQIIYTSFYSKIGIRSHSNTNSQMNLLSKKCLLKFYLQHKKEP